MRDRYFDTLRAAAIVRVIVFHMFGFTWLTYAFPALGVMFALGGSLMAASLQRSTSPARVVWGRTRRVVPALWVLGLVLVPAMLWHGWDSVPWDEMWLWAAPIATPPSSEWARNCVVIVWYIATYLWLVGLSPIAWRAFRRWPIITVLAPLAVLAATQLSGLDFSGRASEVPVNIATFAACWFVGFAHRTGQLQRLHWAVVGGLALLSAGAGIAWVLAHKDELGSVVLNEYPLAQGLYSLGFVLIALRLRPPMGWLARVRPLDGFVTLVNSRAVTIYLWHNVALNLAFVVGDRLEVWRLGDRFVQFGYLAVALPLLLIPLLGVGWVEDVAAKRKPQLFPVGTSRRLAVAGAATVGGQRDPGPGSGGVHRAGSDTRG